MTTKPDTNDLRSCGCKTEMCEHYKNYKHVSRIYCEDCGEIRTEKKTIKAYCFKHLKKHTTKPEWEEEFNNIANSWEEPQFSFERRDALQAHMVKMVFQFKELFASHLTGTVKVEELRTKIIELGKEKNNLIDIEEGKVEAMYLWSVLALLDEKK